MDMNNIRFTQTARRHKIGKASALFVIATYDFIDDFSDGMLKRWWVGDDERGRELEVAAVEGQRDGCCLVIHVFPTALRGKE